ncbi:GGDEF domain-containing protein [Methylopila sp. M107]|uniref:GGDEF domain-containing protein n=1 Tax=Methylopila sp. M107 TaxID=1101190 RepID=UPI0003771BD0|nr:GGDEF domain-containing protein [Methylopila sp. M107]
MGRILLKTAVFTAASVAASLIMCFMANMFLGGITFGWWCMAALCPFVIASAVGFHIFTQNERLATANADLERARAVLAEALERQREYARLDHMTGLLNRESFYREIEHRRRKSDHGSILLIDADEFKSINDTYGHEAGDLALRAIADAIARNVRNKDVVGRVGGEEFAVMLSAADYVDAGTVAERIRADVFALPFEPAPTRRLTVSIGGAELSAASATDEAMRIADRNLYAAKRQGRNRVVLATIADTAA